MSSAVPIDTLSMFGSAGNGLPTATFLANSDTPSSLASRPVSNMTKLAYGSRLIWCLHESLAIAQSSITSTSMRLSRASKLRKLPAARVIAGSEERLGSRV
jgi:hypothetical protein